jgi:hypothetical protein
MRPGQQSGWPEADTRVPEPDDTARLGARNRRNAGDILVAPGLLALGTKGAFR